MRIKSFTIKNFRGIEACTIKLDGPGRITTLIGLNESGKTTILEAFANFLGEDQALLSVIGSHRPVRQLKDFIPKHLRANFTGEISLEATLALEDSDMEALSNHFRSKHHLSFYRSEMDKEVVIERTHKFENSEHKTTSTRWTISFPLKTYSQRKTRNYYGRGDTREIWLSGIHFIGSQLVPRICYFPTFLFEIPEKISLAPAVEKAEIVYYRRVLQDILDARGDDLSLQTHVIDRLAKFRVVDPTTKEASWTAIDQDTKEQVAAVITRMSTELNRVIIGAWNEIFRKKPRGKRVVVEWDFDAANSNTPYCEFKIIDTEDRYSIAERSLGFRWFFCFLLLTQFNSFRSEKRRTYFLLDEPASNLHSSAQLSLLRSFPRIAGDTNAIIYSTHSHYMVEPLWLEGAYIVANRAVDYDDDSTDFDYEDSFTKITATRYREFAASHPDLPTYFQPVLDRLDYRISPLVGSRPTLIMEGKQDFYAAKYFLPALGCTEIDILPGAGAGNMSVLVSLFVGWGRKFLVLLDDDKAGRQQKLRYQEDFLLGKDAVATYGDVASTLKNSELETLFSSNMAALVKKARALSTEPKKKDYALFFQERLALSEKLDLGDIDADTIATMKLVAEFVKKKLL